MIFIEIITIFHFGLGFLDMVCQYLIRHPCSQRETAIGKGFLSGE